MNTTRSIYWTGTLLIVFALATGCESKVDDTATVGEEMAADHSEMTANPDRDAAVELLTANSDRFIEMIVDLSPEELAYRESEGRWSIAEIAEHLIKTEVGLSAVLDSALSSEPMAVLPDSMASSEMIANMLGDRSQQYQAPDVYQPEGVFTTADEILVAWDAARGETINALKEFDGDIRMQVSVNPAVGELDAYASVVFVTSHADRHLAQMQQVKDHSGYAAI